jgi:hypothetical protein
MRPLATFLAATFLVPTLAPFAAFAAEQPPAPMPPPDPMIVAMAQHFVQDRLMHQGGTEHYHIEFDRTFLYSRPGEKLWVVVGGYVSDQNTPNSFTAAVTLDCPDHSKVSCWSLEKLSINGRIVLDRKRI